MLAPEPLLMRGPRPAPRYVLAAIASVLVVVAIAAGIVWATSGNDTKRNATTASTSATATTAASSHSTRLSHRQYALLYLQAILHKTRISVLTEWPSPPYQHYSSGNQDCYEWWDKPNALYNLCFRNGVLSLKAIE